MLELVSGQGMSELRLLASLHAASMLPGQWDVGFNSIGVKYYGQYYQRLTQTFFVRKCFAELFSTYM